MSLFNNKPNIPHITSDGREIWESRSVSVVPIIRAHFKNHTYVLAQKRSHIMNEPGKWSLPCGYLDWNENGWDAVRREVFEETSFLIDKYYNDILFSNNQKPVFVNTEMDEDKQNVALVYSIVFNFHYELPTQIENHKNLETSEVKWINIEDVFNYDWAFNHDKLIFKNFFN